MAKTWTGAIHGDIKPENVLIFGDDTERLVAKVADFGFSTFAVEGESIRMPKSPPWEAPEHHYKGCTISEAKKMEVYSFGMLCLWVLFQEGFGKSLPGLIGAIQDERSLFSPISSENMMKLKNEDRLRFLAGDLIRLLDDLNDRQKENLKMFFDSTLAVDPDRRIAEFEKLIQLLGESA
jgi:serine/threonine protein kinase